jgi:hypothetical protein
MDWSLRIAFRLSTLVFAFLLLIDSAWLLLPQIFLPGIDYLPTNASAAATVSSLRDSAAWAASIGAFRGELWAEAAFTYSDLFLTGEGQHASNNIAEKMVKARQNIEQALSDAPAQPGVWLLRAGLGLHYSALGFNTLEALKMSYYTGPSDQHLIRLRFLTAADANASKDFEIGQFMSRDLRLLLAQRDKVTITEAYDRASPDGRLFIERAVGDIDPSAREWLRAHAQKHSRTPSN